MTFLRILKSRSTLISILGILALGAMGGAYVQIYLPLRQVLLARTTPRRPNVVLVSMCSMSGPLLKLIGGQTTPDLHQPRFRSRFYNLMRGSFRFENSITRHPWVNVTRYLVEKLPLSLLRSLGYDYYYSSGQSLVYRIPQRAFDTKSGVSTDRDYEGSLTLHYKEEELGLRTKMTSELKEPFVLLMHHKYMHFPYYDDVNPNFQKLLRLPPHLKARLEVLKKKIKVTEEDEIPQAVIFNRTRNPDVKPVALLLEEKKYEAWQKSPFYNDDLKIITQLYKAKWENFVYEMQDLFYAYNTAHILDNTIFIFDGDHGESFMQHGQLGHASQVYEEFIDAPLWVRFPPVQPTGNIKPIFSQIDKDTAANLVVDIIKGNVNANNLEAWVKEHEVPEVVSRNCSGTIYSLRSITRWKLIVNFETNERELYDLSRDPKERNNLAANEPARTEDFYEKILLQKAAVDAVVDRDNSACNEYFGTSAPKSRQNKGRGLNPRYQNDQNQSSGGENDD